MTEVHKEEKQSGTIPYFTARSYSETSKESQKYPWLTPNLISFLPVLYGRARRSKLCLDLNCWWVSRLTSVLMTMSNNRVAEQL